MNGALLKIYLTMNPGKWPNSSANENFEVLEYYILFYAYIYEFDAEFYYDKMIYIL